MPVELVDVLIITAADGEDEAVRRVEEGALGDWDEMPGPPNYGFAVWHNRYQCANSGQLRVALTRAIEMGGEGAANAAARLVDAYKPRYLAMCGVCAGNPERVSLGDVIIADRVWRYDAGEQLNPSIGGKPIFYADMSTYQLSAQWKHAAECFSLASSSSWDEERPRERELQAQWLLHELLENRNPLESPARSKRCHDWHEVVTWLVNEKLISVKAGKPKLTIRGRDQIEGILFKQGGQLSEPAAWKTVVGPLGTGNNLVKDVDIWERLRPTQRQVLGLDMESSVIGFTAHVQNVRYIAVKGVMDYAEPGRKQGFRQFAARAAAEVLLGFLRQHAADISFEPADDQVDYRDAALTAIDAANAYLRSHTNLALAQQEMEYGMQSLYGFSLRDMKWERRGIDDYLEAARHFRYFGDLLRTLLDPRALKLYDSNSRRSRIPPKETVIGSPFS